MQDNPLAPILQNFSLNWAMKPAASAFSATANIRHAPSRAISVAGRQSNRAGEAG